MTARPVNTIYTEADDAAAAAAAVKIGVDEPIIMQEIYGCVAEAFNALDTNHEMVSV